MSQNILFGDDEGHVPGVVSESGLKDDVTNHNNRHPPYPPRFPRTDANHSNQSRYSNSRPSPTSDFPNESRRQPLSSMSTSRTEKKKRPMHVRFHDQHLMRFYYNHKSPSEEKYQKLAEETGLSIEQLEEFFTVEAPARTKKSEEQVLAELRGEEFPTQAPEESQSRQESERSSATGQANSKQQKHPARNPPLTGKGHPKDSDQSAHSSQGGTIQTTRRSQSNTNRTSGEARGQTPHSDYNFDHAGGGKYDIPSWIYGTPTHNVDRTSIGVPVDGKGTLYQAIRQEIYTGHPVPHQKEGSFADSTQPGGSSRRGTTQDISGSLGNTIGAVHGRRIAHGPVADHTYIPAYGSDLSTKKGLASSSAVATFGVTNNAPNSPKIPDTYNNQQYLGGSFSAPNSNPYGGRQAGSNQFTTAKSDLPSMSGMAQPMNSGKYGNHVSEPTNFKSGPFVNPNDRPNRPPSMNPQMGALALQHHSKRTHGDFMGNNGFGSGVAQEPNQCEPKSVYTPTQSGEAIGQTQNNNPGQIENLRNTAIRLQSEAQSLRESANNLQIAANLLDGAVQKMMEELDELMGRSKKARYE